MPAELPAGRVLAPAPPLPRASALDTRLDAPEPPYFWAVARSR
jgi:hypothetical protein